MTQLDRAHFQTLFDQFRHSAWRLEIQGWYDEPDEGPLLAQWLQDGDQTPTLAWFADWPERIAEHAKQGKRYSRVRVLTNPLTDYLRWQLGIITAPAISAGEDIRVMPADVAARLPLRTADFWMFDNERVAVLEFEHGAVTGAQLLDDPRAVEPFHAIRATAWDHAVRFEEYSQTRS
ncbi:DUF6879 family protein [Kutzneria sp. CA-103260]|uniref:DUF6879 family protein n=1 Tax=Kutzneria sp. CA-103260 TaxID=2802641 RepID=UPI001BACFD4A|nr:DUF6879 family protein [Kutzneria sp. CA-103260]QUQ71169.1 hypothetical protein JJ691_89530 [Kutzneria sp. CA-103260]